jgi:hypothetical protein
MYLVDAARNAARLQLSVPLDLFRWLLERRPRGKGPERIELYASPPAIGAALTVDLYGTKIDVSANLGIEAIENQPDTLRLSLRVRDLAVRAPEGSPAAMMVQTLDLKRPGTLMNLMPKRHNVLLEARDDLFVLDLFKIRALAENQTLRKVLAALSDAVSITRVYTEGDLLVIGINVNPFALPIAVARLRSG